MNIALMGKARAGKDTAAKVLTDELDYERVAFADPVRDLALKVDPIIFAMSPTDDDDVDWDVVTYRLRTVVQRAGWEVAKGHTEVRHILQTIGAGVRELDPDFWVRMAFEDMARRGWDQGAQFVVTDVRYPNEVAALRTAGFRLVYIDRPGNPAVSDHPSEHAVSEEDADVVIVNCGDIAELHTAVRSVATQ